MGQRLADQSHSNVAIMEGRDAALVCITDKALHLEDIDRRLALPLEP